MNNFLGNLMYKANFEKSTDNQSDVTLSFDYMPIKTDNVLDQYVKGMKISGQLVGTFDNYNHKIDYIVSQTKTSQTELDYRYIKQCEKERINPDLSISPIEKMKLLGKLGEDYTSLDRNSLFGQISSSYQNNKIESNGGFTSIRSNNCLIKGKWCYEVQLNTNGLHQIGWCQLTTPFNNHDGVGDDETSYAYDGYRVMTWHRGKKVYGDLWDVGDIVGCCIDLDERTINYYLNGVHQGEAFKNLPVGKNIAYFPGISFSENEKCTWNFGRSPFHHMYPGYESIDLPDSIWNGELEVTAQCLDILKTNLLGVITDTTIPLYHKIKMSNKILSFLRYVAFEDLFIFKTLIVPTLYDLCLHRPKELVGLFELMVQIFPKKEEFVANFFDTLCNMIEEYSLIGQRGINEWKYLMTILMHIIKIDSILTIWLTNLTKKGLENFKSLFTSNNVRLNDIYLFIRSKHNTNEEGISATKVLFKHGEEFFYQNQNNMQLDEIYREYITQLLTFMITDTREFNIPALKFKSNLSHLLFDQIKNSYDHGIVNEIDLLQQLVSPYRRRDSIFFYKNVLFNLYPILLKETLTLPLDTLSIHQWFTRSQNNSIYYDEVGLGGTISHVTTEYISKIEESFTENKNEQLSNFTHRVIKMTQHIFINWIREFIRNLVKNKKLSLTVIRPHDSGNNNYDKFYRTYFYLLTEGNQVTLYQFSYYLIKWLNHLHSQNKNLIYFIPRSVYEIPYEFLRLLVKIRSGLIWNSDVRTRANSTSPHFADDDYVYQVVLFYTTLFSDQSIANPELKESLIIKIKFFLQKKFISKLFSEKEKLIEVLIKGLLNYMTVESLSHIACEIICKIIKPICFGDSSTMMEKSPLVKITQKFFETNLKTFHEFMDNYSKLINKIMTEYTIILSEASERILNPTHINSAERQALLKRLSFIYNILCDLMKIFEFLLDAYPDEFLDVESLNYSRFCNFMKNLSSRILEKPYIDNLIKLLDMTKIDGHGDSIMTMAYSVIGVFLKIFINKDNPKFKDFIFKFANLSDLHLTSFIDLYDTILPFVTESTREGVENYKEIIKLLDSHKVVRRDRKMSTEEWEEATKNENICILCYTNTSDSKMIPCGHICCGECLRQYLAEKSHCFICNTQVEKVEKVNLSPIKFK